MTDADTGDASVDRGHDGEAAITQAADGEDGVAHTVLHSELGDVEGDVGRARRPDLEVVGATGKVEVAGVIRVLETLDEGIATVGRDVHRRGVSAEVHDTDLGGLAGRGGVIGQDLRDDAVGEAAGRSDRGHGAGLEGQRCIDDDGAFLEGGAVGYDLDLVRATGNLDVVGDLAVGEGLADESTVGIDVDRGRIAGAVEHANLRVLILCADGRGDGHRSGQRSCAAEECDLATARSLCHVSGPFRRERPGGDR